MIPQVEPKQMTPREVVSKLHRYNVQLTTRIKGLGLTIDQLQSSLDKFAELMVGDYGENETIEMPVDVVANMALFSSATVSRLLWEKIKAAKKLTTTKL